LLATVVGVHVSSVLLRDYKRFSALEVSLPEPVRLVMLCGPNGSGKSSLLQAMKLWQDAYAGRGHDNDAEYHHKGGLPGVVELQRIQLSFHEDIQQGPQLARQMYFRTAYRNEPEFAVSSIQRAGDILEGPRPQRMIDNDVRVSDNYQRLAGQTFDAVFNTDDTSTAELRGRLLGRLGAAVQTVLPELRLVGMADPLSGGTFRFAKGVVDDFPYKNLSGGEKAVFDLLLDLAVKSQVFADAVVCIDEPEAHTNPLVQGRLTDALLELMGPDGQLWLATHSVGMLRRARELARAQPVAFVDFADRDFDEPQMMAPVALSRAFWRKTLAASLGDVAELVAPSRLVLCEGQPGRGQRAEFDARCLRAVFSNHDPDVEFVAVGNDRQVIDDHVGLGRAVQAVVPGTQVIRLVDRDERSETEIEALQNAGVTVLGRRNLESYLLDEEVLEAYCQLRGQPEKWPELRQARERAMDSAVGAGKPDNDWKAVKGDIYNAAKSLLALRSVGSTADVFLAEQLAPVPAPGMAVYEELRRDLFRSGSVSRESPLS
jgi:predicted ATPase